MLVLAAMTIIVSIYALSATVYRTALGGLTVNRLMVIGWNLLNLGALILFLAGELRFGFRSWIPNTQRVVRLALIGYGVWTAIVVLVLPFAFR
jgi:hypothetical protein